MSENELAFVDVILRPIKSVMDNLKNMVITDKRI